MNRLTIALVLSLATTASAREYHVGAQYPVKTISAAAALAQPGDTITVHAGIYREWVDPPRGGTSDRDRITYQAAPGETVVITGSEPVKGWVKVEHDTWKVTIPNKFFGAFHPYVEKVDGDWFEPRGRAHHRGCVYVGERWMSEAADWKTVLEPAGATPLWYAKVDGVADESPHLMNLAWFKTAAGTALPAVSASRRSGTKDATCAEGGQCVTSIGQRNWLRYTDVDLGAGTETIEFRAAAASGAGGIIEVRLANVEGELLGVCEVPATGGWQNWQSFTAKIKRTAGKQTLCVLFKPKAVAKPGPEDWGENTTIWAQFPGVNPNEANVEINVRPTVFTPSKTNIDYISVRGFTLRNAATTWAAPTAGQIGLVTAYWCKGWGIENNEVCNSRCSGIALGKYSDEWDGKRGTTEGYHLTIADALKTGGWTKERIGGHVVRNNHIHHCGQTGIVGSLGCAFSLVEGNDIHDCNWQGTWGGAEMAGIKFHGAIDVVIAGNHIYRCGDAGGIWLDWMAQGTQVTGNLIHDTPLDIFSEVNHGPILIANNILLSPEGYAAYAQGGAFAHNLITGVLDVEANARQTPYHKAHSTVIAGLRDNPIGDDRWYNNLLANRGSLDTYNRATLPVVASGNVFTKGARASRFDTNTLVKAGFDPGVKLEQKADGWYLTLTADKNWRGEAKRSLVATEMLGKAAIPQLPFENPDGSALRIHTDYFGKERDADSPFPGPFETPAAGDAIKVWPKPQSDRLR